MNNQGRVMIFQCLKMRSALPKNYAGEWDYSTPPKTLAGANAMIHDKSYDKLQISGASGLLFNFRAIDADWQFVESQMQLVTAPWADPWTKFQAGVSGGILGAMATPKTLMYYYSQGIERNMQMQQQYDINPLDIGRPKW